MEFIKPCPSCNTQLKFPVDQGKLNVKCPHCGFGFSVDPEDSSLYNQGSFYKKPGLGSRFAAWWDDAKAAGLRFLNPVLRRIPRPAPSYESGGSQGGSLPDSFFFIGLFIIVLMTLFIGRSACYNDSYRYGTQSPGQGYIDKGPQTDSTPPANAIEGKTGEEELEEKKEAPAFPSNEKFLHEGSPFKGQ